MEKVNSNLAWMGQPENRSKVVTYGSIAFAILSFSSILYFRKRRKRTQFQRHLDEIHNDILEKMNRNPNKYLKMLFSSFSHLEKDELDKFSKIRSQKLKMKPRLSDPLLPPFKAGMFLRPISSTHFLLFDTDPVSKGQTLICTKDFEFQNLLLTCADFEASLKFIKATEGFCMFASSDKVGAKYNHKHIMATLPNDTFGLLDVYEEEIAARRKNFGREVDSIHARVGVLSEFHYILVGFEKLSDRKEIDLNEDNLRERAKYIYKIYLESLDRLQILKRVYRANYVVLISEEYLLIVNDPHKVVETDLNPFLFAGLGKIE
jgi:ATP adenylyltransferase/5',5'''-P-1,P-4-tetraphosphate phosphorylase II